MAPGGGFGLGQARLPGADSSGIGQGALGPFVVFWIRVSGSG